MGLELGGRCPPNPSAKMAKRWPLHLPPLLCFDPVIQLKMPRWPRGVLRYLYALANEMAISLNGIWPFFLNKDYEGLTMIVEWGRF